MNNREKEIIKKSLLSYSNKKVFTGCALGVSLFEKNNFKRNFFYVGRTDKKETSLPVGENTYFDIASLTKPLVTLLSLLALVKDGKISFEDKMECLLSENVPPDKKKINILDLISHTSGFPPHKPYYKKLIKLGVEDRKNAVIKFIMNEHLDNTPGKSYIYSDLDYILLGHIIEEKSGEKLSSFWKRKILEPLNISQFFEFTKETEKKKISNFVVTGECLWNSKPLCGVVHDDNCRALGSLSGHAGLFSTLEGVLALSENLLLQCTGEREHPSINPENLFFLLEKSKIEKIPYGFDIPSGKTPGSGRFFSKKTIGHLGFTGTSFWIDLEKKIVVALLTNRVIFGGDNIKIKEMRSAIHDVVMSIIKK